MPTDRVMDGVDLVTLARGEAQGDAHGAIFWRSGQYRSVLVGGWKLQVMDRPPTTWLFDLAADPTERRNLARERPDRVAALSAVLAEHERQMVPPAWPSLIEAPIPVDHPLGVPFRDDDEYVSWDN
jgi:arylsulfatase A-like enzyme